MRKIVVFNLVSVDGYFAGPDGNIDWHNVDDEFNKFAVEQTSNFGAIIFGRTTYQMFEEYWPAALTDPKTSEDDRKIAKIIDDIEKIVFSKTLEKVTWKNTKLLHEIDPEEIKKWKMQSGPPSHKASTGAKAMADKSDGQSGDMVVFGSGTIVQAMTNLGLIDEYKLLVNPIILGKGKSMFQNVKQLKLKLIETKEFGNGNILLSYRPS